MNALKRWFKFVVWVEPTELPPGHDSESPLTRLRVFIGLRGRF